MRGKPSQLVGDHQHMILDVVRRHQGAAVWVFGSAASGVDRRDSDLDLLVEFCRGATLLDQAAMVAELEGLLGVDVDVVSVGGLRGEIGASIRASAVPLAS